MLAPFRDLLRRGSRRLSFGDTHSSKCWNIAFFVPRCVHPIRICDFIVEPLALPNNTFRTHLRKEKASDNGGAVLREETETTFVILICMVVETSSAPTCQLLLFPMLHVRTPKSCWHPASELSTESRCSHQLLMSGIVEKHLLVQVDETSERSRRRKCKLTTMQPRTRPRT